MSCQQVPAAPAFNPYPRSVQVGEFEVATGGGIWVAIGGWQHVPFTQFGGLMLVHVLFKLYERTSVLMTTSTSASEYAGVVAHVKTITVLRNS